MAKLRNLNTALRIFDGPVLETTKEGQQDLIEKWNKLNEDKISGKEVDESSLPPIEKRPMTVRDFLLGAFSVPLEQVFPVKTPEDEPAYKRHDSYLMVKIIDRLYESDADELGIKSDAVWALIVNIFEHNPSNAHAYVWAHVGELSGLLSGEYSDHDVFDDEPAAAPAEATPETPTEPTEAAQ